MFRELKKKSFLKKKQIFSMLGRRVGDQTGKLWFKVLSEVGLENLL